MPTQKPSTMLVRIAAPFGGWISTPTGTGTTSLAASMEGNLGSMGGPGQQYGQSTAISLFRLEKMGHISPGDVFGVISDSKITNLALNAAVDSGSNAWYILKNGRVLVGTATSITSNYDPTLNGTHNTHTIATTRNPDILLMKDLASTPVEWVIWSYEDNTDADVAIMKVDGTSEDDDWFSSRSGSAVLKKGVPLKLALGADSNLYVTNGSEVKQVVITGGLASATLGLTLSLGPGWIASGIAVYKNYIAILAYTAVTGFTGITRGLCRVFMWDGINDSFQFAYDIQDNYANGIFFDGNKLTVLTNGRNNSSKLWEFNGSNFEKKFESTLIGTSSNPIQGSLESYQDGLLIAGNTKHVYNFLSGGFHDRAIATDGTNEATDIGFVKNLYQGQLYMGVAISGPAYKIYYQDSFSRYYTPADFRTQLFTRAVSGRRTVPLGYKNTITRIRIFFSQFGTGASVLLSLFNNYDTFGVGGSNDKLNLTIDTDTGTANSARHLAIPAGTNEVDITDHAITDISAFYMNIRFNHASVTNTAAIIRAIEVYVEPST